MEKNIIDDEIEMVIYDGDNTIWDWLAYATPAYEAMAKCISEETGIPEDDIIKAMQDFYVSANSIENEGLVQGLEAMQIFDKVKNYDRTELIRKAQKTYSDVRRANMHVYPGIQKVMKATNETKKGNIILSDAPSFQVAMRIKHSKLSPYIKEVFARPTAKISLPPEIEERRKKGLYEAPFKVTEIEDEKPDTDLEKILKMTKEEIRKYVVIIGDNDKKDMGLARRYGCRGIHAVYGLPTAEMGRRIARFSPQSVLKKNMSQPGSPCRKAENEKTDNSRIYVANTPEDILKILGMR